MAANDSYAELASSCIHWGEGTSSVNETESAWLSRSYTIYGALLRLRMLPLASQTRRKDQRSDSQADGCHPELVSATPGQVSDALSLSSPLPPLNPLHQALRLRGF